MMMNTTLDQLRSLRLQSMAQALEHQLGQVGIAAMSFEERLALLVDCEVHGRQDRRCARLLKVSGLAPDGEEANASDTPSHPVRVDAKTA